MKSQGSMRNRKISRRWERVGMVGEGLGEAERGSAWTFSVREGLLCSGCDVTVMRGCLTPRVLSIPGLCGWTAYRELGI